MQHSPTRGRACTRALATAGLTVVMVALSGCALPVPGANSDADDRIDELEELAEDLEREVELLQVRLDQAEGAGDDAADDRGTEGTTRGPDDGDRAANGADIEVPARERSGDSPTAPGTNLDFGDPAVIELPESSTEPATRLEIVPVGVAYGDPAATENDIAAGLASPGDEPMYVYWVIENIGPNNLSSPPGYAVGGWIGLTAGGQNLDNTILLATIDECPVPSGQVPVGGTVEVCTTYLHDGSQPRVEALTYLGPIFNSPFRGNPIRWEGPR